MRELPPAAELTVCAGQPIAQLCTDPSTISQSVSRVLLSVRQEANGSLA